MNKQESETLAYIGLILAIVALIWQIMRRWPGVGDAIRYVENGNFLKPLPAIAVPTLASGDIVFNLPGFFGDPFAGIPVAGDAKGCGCQPYKCPTARTEFITLPPLIVQQATNIIPPETFSYQAAPTLQTCAWNAPGYLSANPVLYDEWKKWQAGDGAWMKWRKKWRKRGVVDVKNINDFAYGHYTQWGAGEGWKWDC